MAGRRKQLEQEHSAKSFFIKESNFYKTLFKMLIVVALQNLVAYSVNMIDNIMLGSYDQYALSGAAAVNQVFFMVQQFALSIGNTLIVIASQYWGEGRVSPIRSLTGHSLKLGVICSAAILLICGLLPRPVLMLFTNSEPIIEQGLSYLSIIMWTFPLFILSNVMISALRSVQTVNISFVISVISLIVNAGINYTLIFGRFGFPEMGIVGAAIGTLIARLLEFAILVIYLIFVDKKLKLAQDGFPKTSPELKRDYKKSFIPIAMSQILWGVSVPMQTAILGHLSDDAIAANSVATTFYQYLKVIVIAMSSVSAVMMGNAIGQGHREKVKAAGRTLSVIDVLIGLVLALALFLLKDPLLSMYNLNESATVMARNLIIIMSIVMIGMSYQMPVSFGVIQGSGDSKFTMKMNLISTWLIVMPLSFLTAFVLKWPVEAVVFVIQSDQIFKGLPTFLRFRTYKWINKLTS